MRRETELCAIAGDVYMGDKVLSDKAERLHFSASWPPRVAEVGYGKMKSTAFVLQTSTKIPKTMSILETS